MRKNNATPKKQPLLHICTIVGNVFFYFAKLILLSLQKIYFTHQNFSSMDLFFGMGVNYAAVSSPPLFYSSPMLLTASVWSRTPPTSPLEWDFRNHRWWQRGWSRHFVLNSHLAKSGVSLSLHKFSANSFLCRNAVW